MISFIDTLISVIIFVLVWALYSCIIMFHIRYTAKKEYKKNEISFPYFHYPFYKKLFLLGLKGALNPVIVVFTFILNISTLLLLIFGIWQLILPNIYVSYIFRSIVMMYLIAFFAKLIFYLCVPPKFK